MHMKTTKIYLSTPYTDKSAAVRDSRYEMARALTARLMSLGHCVFSPIIHGHAVGNHLPEDKTFDHEFWMRQDLPWLLCSDVVYVHPENAMFTSRGVGREVSTAMLHHIPVITDYAVLLDFLNNGGPWERRTTEKSLCCFQDG